IMLSVDRYRSAQRSNIVFILVFGVISILGLSILIFFSIRRIVISPLRTIEDATKKIQEGTFEFELNFTQKDEIGKLARAFNLMRKKILKSTSRLKTSEEKYRNLINHSLEAVAIVDSSDNIVDNNKILEKLSLYPNEELLKMKLSHFLGTHEKKLKKRSFMDSNVEYFESVLITKDSLEIPVEIYKIKGISLDGKNKLAFAYIRDLTERKMIEKYSIQTEKMFALGQLSSGIAHEIRNPLFSLTNNIEYLKEKSCDEKAFEEVYPELKYGLKRIQKIVSTILDYAKPHEVDFRVVDLKEIIEKSISLVTKQFEKSAVKIVTKFSDGDYEIQADPHKIEQVFLNLFLNSFHAMESHGILTISVVPQRQFLKIKVADTGKGIPQKDLERIFDPFYSKSSGGTGLGLCIVQRILDQHNAKYDVKSEENFGTTFTIHLRREK
ncbi:MAG: PAS domain S-box protein, partial [Candidatus Marinimicrobia bacterium]|nr:PAS domain S-box protein [Candidatus Neomarinimicrobiota bacterium]